MRKKKHDRTDPPPPAMFVGDEEPSGARVPEPSTRISEPPTRVPEPPARAAELPAARPPVTERQDIRLQLQGFFALPSPEPSELPSPAQPATNADASDGANLKAVGCVTVLVLMIVSKLVEDVIPMSVGQKYLGLGIVVVVALLISVWTSLHDSDLGYADRGSDRWMARFRNRLRQLFDIPVI